MCLLLKITHPRDQHGNVLHQSASASQAQVNTISDQLGVRVLGKKLVNRGAEACRLVNQCLELGTGGVRQYIRCAHACEKRLCIQANHLWDLAQWTFWRGTESGKL